FFRRSANVGSSVGSTGSTRTFVPSAKGASSSKMITPFFTCPKYDMEVSFLDYQGFIAAVDHAGSDHDSGPSLRASLSPFQPNLRAVPPEVTMTAPARSTRCERAYLRPEVFGPPTQSRRFSPAPSTTSDSPFLILQTVA